jgi:hypothetical protein
VTPVSVSLKGEFMLQTRLRAWGPGLIASARASAAECEGPSLADTSGALVSAAMDSSRNGDRFRETASAAQSLYEFHHVSHAGGGARGAAGDKKRVFCPDQEMRRFGDGTGISCGVPAVVLAQPPVFTEEFLRITGIGEQQKTRSRIQATSTIESDGLRSGRNRVWNDSRQTGPHDRN